MNDAARILFEQLGISLLLGLLVGLQRQHTSSPTAGVRTFPLVSILGTLAAAIDQAAGQFYLVPAGLLAVVSLLSVGRMLEAKHKEKVDFGTTTEAAMLLMYVVGAYLVFGERIVAVAVGGGVAVLLQFKGTLHGIARRLGNEDLQAIMTFVLITCVVLPVLPNRTYELMPPLDVLNPFEIWMMVVFMVGISLGSYLLYKFVGDTVGILLSGFLGGVISSTATTLSYARRVRENEGAANIGALIIGIASLVVDGRVMLEIAVVAPHAVQDLIPPIACIMAASAVVVALMWLSVQHRKEEMPRQKNPTELKSALIFAALYAGVLMALSATRTYFDGQGLFVVAALSGLTDLDAITLSTARMTGGDPEAGGIATSTAWRLIAVGIIANLFFKWCLCASIGGRALAWRVAILFAVPAVTAGLLIAFWPA